jgi:hypothetical protein
MSRVVASAIEAAFETDDDEPRRSRHRGVKVLAAGAAVVAAARVASSQSPKLSRLDALTTLGKVTRVPDMFRNVPDRVRDRLADGGWIDEESELGPEDVAAEDEELDEDEEFDEDFEGDEDYGEPEEEESPRARPTRALMTKATTGPTTRTTTAEVATPSRSTGTRRRGPVSRSRAKARLWSRPRRGSIWTPTASARQREAPFLT